MGAFNDYIVNIQKRRRQKKIKFGFSDCHIDLNLCKKKWRKYVKNTEKYRILSLNTEKYRMNLEYRKIQKIQKNTDTLSGLIISNWSHTLRQTPEMQLPTYVVIPTSVTSRFLTLEVHRKGYPDMKCSSTLGY